jgi:hypothetical protein
VSFAEKTGDAEQLFPPELEREAFRENNGEFGWTRGQVPAVVEILRSRGIGILGGELWWRLHGLPDRASIPQRQGLPAIYVWETKREAGEPWSLFIERGANEALAAAERWPMPNDLPPDLPGRIFYNLTWVSEKEYAELSNRSR